MIAIRKKRQGSGLIGLVFAILLFAATAFAWTQRQALYDWSRLRNYDPPTDIERLADETTMSQDARHLFYVYHPQLNDRTQFANNCGNTGEQTIVLGCYVSNLGIYLFDVDDKRLEGVEQVTAAHEMLHVAYERLSSSERQKVDNMTAQVLGNLNDDRIKKTIDNYRSRDESIVPNELHSILATEVRELPADLEEYYKQYFANRAQVVAFSEKYESTLTERRNNAASLEAQISGLKSEIELQEKSLNEQRDGLQRDRGTVDTQPEVESYNRRVREYNANIGHLNDLIERYNALVEEFKKTALEAQELYKALDSRPTL